MFTLLMALLMTFGLAACGGDDEKNDVSPQDQGGLTPDPTIPTIGDITYELSPSAVLVPEAVAKQITNVDVDNHQFTLPASATKPEVGQTLIINTPTDALHDGLLAKVKAVDESSGGYVVTYEDADLKDAFKTIEIPEQYIPLGDYVEHVYDADGNEISFETAASTRSSGHKNLVIPLPEAAWSLGYGIELTPKMTIDLLLRYVLMYGDYQIDYANMKVDADVSIGADIVAELASKNLINYRKTLLTIFCAGIPVGPVVITPGVEVAAVFKVDGKLSLEASVSYTRTVHANVMYQKGKGLSGECKMDPEGDDALKFTFGPKLEGSVSYGLSAGPFLGIYGKTFAVNLEMDSYLKESISGKFNLVEVSTSDNMIASDPIKVEGTSITVLGTKWDFAKWDGLMFSQAFCIQPKANASFMGKKTEDLEISEVSIPIDSRNVLPQVKVEEKDFYKQDGNVAKLTLRVPKKSLLDKDVKYRAEWTRVGATSNEQPVTSYFTFGDDERALLENPPTEDIKKNGITIEAKGTLKAGENYTLKVFMELLGMEFTLFQQSVEAWEIKSLSAHATLTISAPGFRNGEPDECAYNCSLNQTNTEFKTSMSGSRMHVDCMKKDTQKTILSFDIDNVNAITPKTAKIENLKFTDVEEKWEQEYNGTWYPTSYDCWGFTVPSLPMLRQNHWIQYEENGLTITNFKNQRKTWNYSEGWDNPVVKEYNFTLHNNELNYVEIRITWK